MNKEFNLSEKRKELLDLMLSKTPEDNSPLAIMFKKLVKDLFNSIQNQDKEFIKRLKPHLNEWQQDRLDKLAGDKLLEKKDD